MRRMLSGLALASFLGIPVWARAQTIQVNTFLFEAGDEPSQPEGWQSAAALSATGKSLWIVAFPGQIRRPWREWLERNVTIVSYVPTNAYLVYGEPSRAQAATRAALATAVQPYRPAYKVSADLAEFAFRPVSAFATADVKIVTVDARSQSQIVSALLGQNALLIAGHRPEEFGVSTALIARLTQTQLQSLASDPRVVTVEQFVPFELSNDTSGVVLRTRTGPLQPNSFGLTGNGEMIGIADTGLSNGMNPTQHLDFQDSTAYGGITPKVFQITSPISGCANGADDCGHGTHVAGTAAGTGLASGGPGYEYKGEAYNAQIFYQDTAPPTCVLSCIPGDLTIMFGQAYSASVRCRVHTNSWGQPAVHGYNSYSHDVDNFVFNHKDMVICFAAGNNGPGSGGTTVISPSTAKDCLSVGACYNQHGPQCTAIPPPLGTLECTPQQTPDLIAPFSSWGPTSDGRLKPDIVSPGDSVKSCQVGTTNQYSCWCGTSMATPNMAGFCALVREYFRTQANPPHNPNASLVKATVLNGGYWPAGTAYNNDTWGYGRGDLTQSLFPPAPTTWIWEDEQVAFDTCSESTNYSFNVTDGSVPFRMTLVWSDAPALAGASPALVNSLDLTVTTPLGTMYRGNHLPAAAGLVTLPDRRNTVQQVWVKPTDPGFSTGVWSAKVSSISIPMGPQPYSIVASYGAAVGTTPTPTVTPGGPTYTSTSTVNTCTPTVTATPTQTFTITLTFTISGTSTPSGTFTPTITPTLTPTPPNGPVVVAGNPISIASGLQVQFAHVPPGATIKIYNMAGELLATLTDSATGLEAWNGATANNFSIVKGVYAFVATWPGGGTPQVGRFAITP